MQQNLEITFSRIYILISEYWSSFYISFDMCISYTDIYHFSPMAWQERLGRTVAL